ncbi:MAG TPA: ArdC family protein [Thermoanaerobaculia bacterium]|nr:ArdC family protein [Thermoanaerobaculia bacterium]
MSQRDRVREVYGQLLEAFREGRVPGALANVFLVHGDFPAATWSWRNRVILALHGHSDARTYRQWRQVGRQVKKGEQATWVLRPMTRKAKDEEMDPRLGEIGAEADLEEKPHQVVVGFAPFPVFGASQTEGEPLPYQERHRGFLDSLPLVELARSWGLEVQVIDHPHAAGFFQPERSQIGLGVANLATWSHELVHAAEARMGRNLRADDLASRELVAEVGGAVLLTLLGYEKQADAGGAYQYARSLCDEDEGKMLSLLTELIDRTCKAVQYVLDEAEKLAPGRELIAAIPPPTPSPMLALALAG